MSDRFHEISTRPRRPRNQFVSDERQLSGSKEFASWMRGSNPRCDRIFHALAEPTRRSIFEHLSHGGELAVPELIKHAGVSQQAVAKHLGVLQLAGLVSCRRDPGRRNYYSARPRGAEPLLNWLAHQGILGEQLTVTPVARERALHTTGALAPTQSSSASHAERPVAEIVTVEGPAPTVAES
jgi:DNA-binding transcriptional ArsR family regulator